MGIVKLVALPEEKRQEGLPERQKEEEHKQLAELFGFKAEEKTKVKDACWVLSFVFFVVFIIQKVEEEE